MKGDSRRGCDNRSISRSQSVPRQRRHRHETREEKGEERPKPNIRRTLERKRSPLKDTEEIQILISTGTRRSKEEGREADSPHQSLGAAETSGGSRPDMTFSQMIMVMRH